MTNELTWYAVLDLGREDSEWLLIPSSVEIKSDEEQLVLVSPTPKYFTGERVYVPTCYWYRKELISEVEPIITRNQDGSRSVNLGYWVNGPGISIPNSDFFTSRLRAVWRAWQYVFREWFWKF